MELLTTAGPVAVECSRASLHVECVVPSAYDVGLVSGAVNPLGFALRLSGSLVEEQRANGTRKTEKEQRGLRLERFI